MPATMTSKLCHHSVTTADLFDRYNYRYHGGESYRDVVIRLEPIIMEMERGENIMVVTHQAVLRCIYAYFMNVPQDQSPWMEIPLHTVIKLTPRAYGTQVERYLSPPPCCTPPSLLTKKKK